MKVGFGRASAGDHNPTVEMCGGPCSGCHNHIYSHGPGEFNRMCIDCYVRGGHSRPSEHFKLNPKTKKYDWDDEKNLKYKEGAKADSDVEEDSNP